jgi:hypothetical protein
MREDGEFAQIGFSLAETLAEDGTMRARAENVEQSVGRWRRIVRVVGVAGMVLVIGLAASPVWASSVRAVRSGVDPCTDESPVASALGEPFGYFDGVGDNLSQNVLSGTVPLIGWALDDNGVLAVDVLVDSAFQGRARYGDTRPDVGALFSGFPDGVLAGWYFELDSTNFLNGEHVVTAQVISKSGEVKLLNARVYQFDNNTHNLVPFGQIDRPSDNTDMHGKCDLSAEPRRYIVISGYALDAGVEINDHGVGNVELLLDGAIIRSTRLHCVHHPVKGAYTDCYGQRRLDVERHFPRLRDAPNSGFRFVIDVGELVNFGWTEGHHTFTVRVIDIDNQVANIDTLNADFFCDPLQGQLDQGAIGAIDDVSERPQATGILVISGWALDPDRIERIKIYVDGVFVGNAVYGFPRPDITNEFPGFPDTFAPGWIFNLDTTKLSHGFHSVQGISVDRFGFEDTFGEIGIEVANP